MSGSLAPLPDPGRRLTMREGGDSLAADEFDSDFGLVQATDEPAFTQPLLYAAIRSHPTPREVWGARLVREGLLSDDEVKALEAPYVPKRVLDHG